MPVTRGVAKTTRLYLPRLGTRLLRPAPASPSGLRQPPTVSAFAQIASWQAATTPRTLPSVSWNTGDVVVVLGATADSATTLGTPTVTGLTFAANGSPSTAASACWVHKWTAVAGSAGSGTISLTATGGGEWGAAVWVFTGSDGVGNGAAATPAVNVKTLVLATSQENSAVVELLADWGAGSTSGAAWTPSGATATRINSDGGGTTYSVLGTDWADRGAVGTASYGLTAGLSTTANISIVALEILGKAVAGAAPAVKPNAGPVQARRLPVRGGRTASRAGTLTVSAPQTGPPVYPLGHPVQARQLPQRGGNTASRRGTFGGVGPPVKPPEEPVQARRLPTRGGWVQARTGVFGGVGSALKALASAVTARLRTLPPRGRSTGRSGVYAGLGPPVKPAEGPAAAKSLPLRGGRVAGRAGTFTATVPQAGPPVYPLGHPVAARRLPARGGRVTRAAGTYAGTGPTVRPAEGPVRAQALPARGGRVVARVGTFTAGAPQAGPPVYPLGHPVCARRPPARGGYVNRRSGPYAGTGPAAPQLRQPVAGGRQQPPPPIRGRTGSLRGPYQGTGPKVRPLSGPVRARLPGPVRTGRVDTTLLPAVAVPPPAFSVGGITAGVASTAGIGGGASSTAGLAATTSGTSGLGGGSSQTGGISATTAPTGGP